MIVDEAIPAEQVAGDIRQARRAIPWQTCACSMSTAASRSGKGKKSLAYSLTYQAPDRTLTDQEVTQIRQRIVRRLEQELNARLRS